MATLLSSRCQNIAQDNSSVNYILESLKNPYDKENNPDGFINMGTAVNGLTRDLITEKLLKDDIFKSAFLSENSDEKYNMYDYFQEEGNPRLRQAAANYISKFFNVKYVNPDCIRFGTGALSCLDVLSHFIGDPGDVVMCVTPQYPMIETILKSRSLLEMWPIPLTSQTNFKLTLDHVRNSYDNAVRKGKKVRGIILLNPGNPIGQIYEERLIKDIMNFCAEVKIHVVIDEIYANSIFRNKDKFKSVLSLENIPDPERTHMLYGVSKDFGLTKFRVGFVHTYNKGILNAWTVLGPCQAIAYPIAISTAKLLEDLAWCDNFFRESASRLLKGYEFVSGKLTAMGVDYVQSDAAFYIWVDLTKYCESGSPESENELFKSIVDECQMYISPSGGFNSQEKGWFRILFTKPMDELEESMKRLGQFLKKKDNCNKSSLSI